MNPLAVAIAGSAVWYLAGIALALMLLPLFRSLVPDKSAWAMSRLIGPAAVAWLALSPSIVLSRTRFDRFTITVAIVTLAATGMGIWWRSRRQNPFAFDAAVRRDLIGFEITWLTVIFSGALLLPYLSSISGLGERLRDSAIWMGIFSQHVFPISDPWLAGQPLRYYTFGYYTQAVTASFVPYSPLETLHLLIPSVYAGFVAAIYHLLRQLTLPRLAASFGAIAVGFGSNLKSTLLAAKQIAEGGPFAWWDASRVVKDTINEFPFWTFSFGDVHPHFLALPLLPITLALVVAFRQNDAKIHPQNLIAVAGAVVGMAWGTNTWEVPVLLSTILIAVAIAPNLNRREKAMLAFSAVCFALIVEFPFFRYRTLMPMRLGIVSHRSSTWEFTMMFGLFLIPIYLQYGLRHLRRKNYQWLIGATLLGVVGFAANDAWLLIVPLALLVVIDLFATSGEQHRWQGALILGGLTICLGCEFVHLEDIYGEQAERMNTVFKMYLPAWTLLGVGAYLAMVEMWRRKPVALFRAVGVSWAVGLVAYVTVGLSARTGGYRNPQSIDGLSELAAEARDDVAVIRWMREEVSDGRLKGVLLEAVGEAYSVHGRVASTTGLPGFAGWIGAGYQTLQYWRAGETLLGERATAAKRIYDGEIKDCGALREELQNLAIDYVFVGKQERKRYAPKGIQALFLCLPSVHLEGDAVLLSSR